VPRRCSICYHGDRETIDELLLAKTSQVLIAEQFKVSPDAVFNHNKQHLHLPMARAAEKALAARPRPARARLERAQNAIELARGTDLLGEMGKLVHDATRIKQRAEEKLDLRTALQAVRELCRLIELAGRLTGQLASGNNVNVGVFGGDPMQQPFTVAMVDQILRERSDRTGVEDDYSHFHDATADFLKEDFAALWQWCAERVEKRTSLLLEAASAPEQPADGPEAHPSDDRGQNASTEGSNGH
jgi:hypothetical protein